MDGALPGEEVVVNMEVPANSNFRVAVVPCSGDVRANLVLGDESLATMSPVVAKDDGHDHDHGDHGHNKFHVAHGDEEDEKEEPSEVIVGEPLGYSGLDYSSRSKSGTFKLTLSTSKTEGLVDVFWTTQNDQAWPLPNLPGKKTIRLKEYKGGESFTIEWDAATTTGDAGEVTYGYFVHAVTKHQRCLDPQL
eukprot:TRINITY_DN67855_c6_g3_i1.p2 TRINITY_DN67855_c6_g3~~TRINITY_DN67855_c6_g3_i1.p2  ORF type:complete len:192 (-),score=28.76 TRINITY_DN67855_c6_g3_i1:429-1004(-)